MKRKDLLAAVLLIVAGTPDAGIWEFRSDARPQTFSSLMCFCAADRMARIARWDRPVEGLSGQPEGPR